MNSLFQRLSGELENKNRAGLRRILRPLASGVLDLASNDYLGFARHEAVVEAARMAVSRFGAGGRASRLVSGHNELHAELESALAAFKGCERALLFSSGYAANLAVVTALANKGDTVFCDKRSHASLVDACRLASVNGAKVRFYDGCRKLRSLLEGAFDDHVERFIVSDAVYSMDGDLADVPALLKLAREFGATLILDDAHGTGTLGANGGGASEHFGLKARFEGDYNERLVQVGTLSKALGSQGGFVVGARVVIEYLVNAARPFIYSTALNPAACGAALAALNLLKDEPAHLKRLVEVKERLGKSLEAMGLAVHRHESPILPVFVGEAHAALKFSEKLLSKGIWCPAIRPPTVRLGTSRLRVTASAGLSDDEVARAVDAFAKSNPQTGTE